MPGNQTRRAGGAAAPAVPARRSRADRAADRACLVMIAAGFVFAAAGVALPAAVAYPGILFGLAVIAWRLARLARRRRRRGR